MADDSDEEEECGDSYLQACYVLQRPSATPSKSRKREKDDPRSRSKAAFHIIWKYIEGAAQAALEEMNSECFRSIQQWTSSRHFCKAQLNLYMKQKTSVLNSANLSTKRLSTAVLFTGSVESSDSQSVFDSLADCLQDGERFRAARLQPDTLVNKNGVGVPIRAMFKQFMDVNPETTDMEILAAWHREPANSKLMLAVIVEDAEHASGSLLAELLVILSEWAVDLPLVLILGMSTTGDSLRMLLPASVMDRLHVQCFSLQSPLKRLEAVIQAVLIDCPFMFTWGGSMVKYFYEIFHTHDNSVSSFLRVLKVSCVEHFCRQPLSFLCVELVESPSQVKFENVCDKLSPSMINYASELLAAESDIADIKRTLAEALWRFKANRRRWSVAFQCFLAAGKRLDFTFSDVFYGALTSSKTSVLEKHGNTLTRIAENLRLLSVPKLAKLVEDWATLAADLECCKEVELIRKQVAECSLADNPPTGTPTSKPPLATSRRVRSLMGCDSPVTAPQNPVSTPPKQQKRPSADDQKSGVLKMAMDFLERLQRDYLVAPEAQRFHELFCFNDVETLKQALTGETRQRIHSDLLDSHTRLNCSCCPADGSPCSSSHDTAIAYILSQEHNELINVHDWYQSFEMVRSQPSKKQQRKRKSVGDETRSDRACTQAAFCRAVTELHVTGLVRLPKKKHPDSVQRIAFGL